MPRIVLVWFRQDLRLEDHEALWKAQEYEQVIPLFILPKKEQPWAIGGASRWWLHYSLDHLCQRFQEVGLSLILRVGDPLTILSDLVKETEAEAVFWHRRYEPSAIEEDRAIKTALEKQGIKVKSFKGRLLFEPWEVLNKQHKPFQVFTPFWNTCLAQHHRRQPLKVPTDLRPFKKPLKTLNIKDLDLLPQIPWDTGLQKTWQPGTTFALKKAHDFVDKYIHHYHETRDRPDLENGVSHLSPYLHFGEISPLMLWHMVEKKCDTQEDGPYAFLRQLGWREFAYHLLYHFPFTPEAPLKEAFKAFSWVKRADWLKAWQKGQTGYPFVDAGMRELWTTGWMHNRVRLVVGSFLVKDLRLHWLEGEKWFWDTLVDADLANNCLGWQWVAGCGADAAPYFRIFNPVSQSEKFDPEGFYIRKWVPELAKLPTKWIHQPWEAPYDILASAGVKLGLDYPYPIVDHREARIEALEAFEQIKQKN
ncbi:MAG: cryptochrome/photolyase family protein [Parachlamydiaceae bacterium]